MFQEGGVRLAAVLRGVRELRAGDEQIRRLREFAEAGDPLADAVVAAGAAEQVERALTGAGGPRSAEASALLAAVGAVPGWLDRARLDRGARAITRIGLLGLFPLGDLSLMGGYLASRATKSLVGTGDLQHRATRRLVETAAWWIDVTTPGALAPGGPGYVAAVRIRLVHGHVRAAMARRPDWDHAAWDRPVNQVQTVGTLLLFSQVFLIGAQLLGVRYSERERGDIMHLWRYVGWLMGVADELLPADEGDAWRMLWLLAATEFIPDEDSRRLATALLDSHAAVGDGRGTFGRVLSHVSVRTHASVSRLMLGRSNADFLGLPDDPVAQAAVLTFAGLNFAAETARRSIPGATRLAERFGAATRRAYLARMQKVFAPDRTYARHLRPAA